MKISKAASGTLMASNLIATVLVISIHYGSKGSIDLSHGYDLNYYIQEFLTNGIARVAVPFFAMLSGFFIYSNVCDLNSYILTLRHKFKSLLVPYVISSVVIFISYFLLMWVFKSTKVSVSLSSVVYNVLAHPISTQFWFLRDLILLVVVSPVLFSGQRHFSKSLFVVLLVMWVLDIQLFPIVADWYLISIETLFFFFMGGLAFNYRKLLDSFINSGYGLLIGLLVTWMMVLMLRIWIDPGLDVWYVNDYTLQSLILYKIGILVGLLCLVRVSAFFRNSDFVIYWSGFSFFAFLFHLIPLVYVKLLTGRIIEDEWSFYVNFPIALALVFGVGNIFFKIYPSAFNLLTGGRGPLKMMARVS